MGKRGQQNAPRKKKEIFFNFKSLRQNLNDKQKTKLIKFFTHFRSMYITVKRHLFQVNKMYDLMEQEYKQFQKDLFKDDEFLSGPNISEINQYENKKFDEDIGLEEDVMDQIFKDEELKVVQYKKEEDKKDEKPKDNHFGELQHDFLGKDLDEIMNETKQKYDNSTNILNHISQKISENEKNVIKTEEKEKEKKEENNKNNVGGEVKNKNEYTKKEEKKNDNDDFFSQKFFDYKTWGNK